MTEVQPNVDLIGKTLYEAAVVLNEAGFSFRVIERDGVPFGATCNVDPLRYNLKLVSGKVAAYTLG